MSTNIQSADDPENISKHEKSDIVHESVQVGNTQDQSDPTRYTDFDRWAQSRRILFRMLVDFVFSAGLWAAFVAILVSTENMGVLSRTEKNVYTAATTGIPLLLGVQTVSAYKTMAGIARWPLLAYGQYTPEETDMILGLGSYITVAKLAWRWSFSGKASGRHYGRAMACVIWIVILVATQVSIGLLGLVFETVSEGALLSQPGKVSVARLDHYYFGKSNTTTPDAGDMANEQYLAHLYGDGSGELYLGAPTIESITGEAKATYGEFKIYKVDGTTDWIYKFQDWTTIEDESSPVGVMSVTSDRSVKISSDCAKYPLEDWSIVGLDSGRKSNVWRTSATDYSMFGPGAVSFLNPDYSPVIAPPDGTQGLSESLCGGLRCAAIGIYAMTTAFRNGTGTFYECNITVSRVEGPGAEHQEMSDKVARLAAGSIGLDGIIYNRTDKDGTFLSGEPSQFVRYNNDSLWGREAIYSNDPEKIANLVGAFAAGSVANLDNLNPYKDTEIQGRKVEVGVKVEIKRLYIWLMIGLTLGVHFILIPIVVYMSSAVLCRDDSYLSAAVLLKPITHHLAALGAAVPGKTLAQHADPAGKYRYGYTELSVHGEERRYQLGIKGKDGMRFPNGLYE